MMNNNTKTKRSANSILPLGAAAGILLTIGLVTWYSQGIYLVKADAVAPIKAEQERIDVMLSDINKKIEKAKQLKIQKQAETSNK